VCSLDVHFMCVVVITRRQVLIVDEVSMLSSELLEKLADLAKIVRNNQRPFGGIQLLFVGDFLQVLLAWCFTLLLPCLSFYPNPLIYHLCLVGLCLMQSRTFDGSVRVCVCACVCMYIYYIYIYSCLLSRAPSALNHTCGTS